MNKALRIGVGLLLLLAALAGVGVAFAWAPDRPVSALAARWAGTPSRFLDLQGMQVHVRDEGPRDAPAIVLLHGTSASLHTWDGWAAQLKARYRVIRADLPGFGLTGPTPDGDYRMPVYTRFTVALLDALGVQRAVLVGNSLGGFIAWKTALDFPERVSRLVLVDASGYAYQPKSMPIGFRLAQIPALAPLIANLLPRNAIESSVRNVYGDPSKISDDVFDRYYELTLRTGNRRALVERFKQNPGGAYETQIARVKQPTLILWGEQDRLIPPLYGRRFQHDIAGSQLVTFAGLGHVPQEEDPARTVAAVETFLATAAP